MKIYFIIEKHKYYIRRDISYDEVIGLYYDINREIFGDGKDVKLYLKDYIIKSNIIKRITTYPLPKKVQSSWEHVECSKLWDTINKTGILRSVFYKTLLDDINRQIDFTTAKLIHDINITGVDINKSISLNLLDVLKEKHSINTDK